MPDRGGWQAIGIVVGAIVPTHHRLLACGTLQVHTKPVRAVRYPKIKLLSNIYDLFLYFKD
jgi:hypothetical protein